MGVPGPAKGCGQSLPLGYGSWLAWNTPPKAMLRSRAVTWYLGCIYQQTVGWIQSIRQVGSSKFPLPSWSSLPFIIRTFSSFRNHVARQPCRTSRSLRPPNPVISQVPNQALLRQQQHRENAHKWTRICQRRLMAEPPATIWLGNHQASPRVLFTPWGWTLVLLGEHPLLRCFLEQNHVK